MPTYKTHSIHGELILPDIDKKIEIKKEDIKAFCMGPDAMILTDNKTFNYQHTNKTRDYFVTMINLIKEKKLYDNSEVMAFLYGQVDHFILDVIMHPLIYYMTEGLERKHKIKPHGLIENWIDDYTTQKYNKTEILYYHKWFIKNLKLMKIIDETYKEVYGVKNESLKYSFGIFTTVMFDTLIRKNVIGIVPIASKIINTGDFTYKKDLDRVLPYLNLNKDTWYNPETGEKYTESFEELWKKSIEITLETINDINNYLYQDKQLTNPYIMNNISYNTGFKCEKGQHLKYVKRYK